MDSFVREQGSRLNALARENAAQAEEIRSLRTSLAEVNGRLERLTSASVDERTQDLLEAASTRAADLVAEAERAVQARLTSAQRQVEVIEERARQEVAWRRRQLNTERAELAQQKSAMRTQLASFRALAVDATRLPETRQVEPLAARTDEAGDVEAARAPVGVSEQHS